MMEKVNGFICLVRNRERSNWFRGRRLRVGAVVVCGCVWEFCGC